jgi:hypothetical protein
LGIAFAGNSAVDSPFSISQNPNDLLPGCFSLNSAIAARQAAKEGSALDCVTRTYDGHHLFGFRFCDAEL